MKSNMIEQYFTSKDKLYNRVYQILNVVYDEFSRRDFYSYNIKYIQETDEYLKVDLDYQAQYEDYTDEQMVILPKTLLTKEYSEEDVISFWKDYFEKEEAYESRYTLEQTLLGLDEELLGKLSSLEVDISQLEEYSYRNEILSKLMED